MITARSTRALGYLSAGEVWRRGRFCIRGCWRRSCLPPRRFTVRQRYPKHVHSSENGSPPSKLIRVHRKPIATYLPRWLGSLCGAFCAGLKIVGLSPAKCLAYSSQEEYMSHSIGRPYSSQLECVSHSIHRIVFTGNWGY